MRRILRAGLVAGVVGGALDLGAAMVVYPLLYGTPVLRIPQSVASGVLGGAAFEGGWATVLLGTVLQFVIATGAGLVLAVAMHLVPFSRSLPATTGGIFGIAVYFFMQNVVLPLSKAVVRTPNALGLSVALGIHVFVLGVPMAFVVRKLLGPASFAAPTQTY